MHDLPDRIRLGTCSFSSKDWIGVFYPPGTKSGDFLAEYARRLDTVEIDATFYGTPVARTVEGWYRKTPPGFLIASKVPREITHEKKLRDCAEPLEQFLQTMDILEEKRGPVLFQFQHYGARSEFPEPGRFLERLAPVLEGLDRRRRYAVEVRNREWIGPPLLDLLRAHGVALALIDHPAIRPIGPLWEEQDLVTADFSYIRWLGDRRWIERITRTWERVVVNRERELRGWVGLVRQLLARDVDALIYANNHYNGHGPGALELFGRLWWETPEKT